MAPSEAEVFQVICPCEVSRHPLTDHPANTTLTVDTNRLLCIPSLQHELEQHSRSLPHTVLPSFEEHLSVCCRV